MVHSRYIRAALAVLAGLVVSACNRSTNDVPCVPLRGTETGTPGAKFGAGYLSWSPKWDTDPDKNRKEKSVLTPTVSFADRGFRGSPAPQNDREKEQERKNRDLFVDSFQSEPQCNGITLKLKNPGDADFGLQVFNGVDGRTGRWQYVLYRMDTLGERQQGETTDGPKGVAQSVCSAVRGTAFTRGGSVE